MAKKPTPANETISAPSTDVRALPPRVQEMREAILAAVQARDIEALRPAIERNETLPIFASGPQRPKTFAQAVDFLRSRSQDKKGADILHVLEAIFAQPYVKNARGQSVTYVWPAFTLTQEAPATRQELAQQWRCILFSSLSRNLDKPPAVQRIGIGADGTWHYFWGGIGE